MYIKEKIMHLRKKENLSMDYCGYLGPRPSTPGQSAQPKSPKGIRPSSQPAQERSADPPPGYPKGIRPRSQLAHKCSANPPPGRPGISYPGRHFNSSAYFSNQQLYQTLLPTGSPHYKCEFTHELAPSPLTE